MNSGIYALYWWEQDLVYIGLSQHLDNRHSWHMYQLACGKHTNYKVQSTYNLYGDPEFIVLEYCSVQELPEKEVQWCNEFKATGINGLCIIKPGTCAGFGTECASSVYTKEDILAILYALANLLDLHNLILNALNIGVGTIDSISAGRNHVWIQEEYPDLWQKVKKNLSLRKSVNKTGTLLERNGVQLVLKSPEGFVFTISNISQFCREHPLLANNPEASAKGISRLSIGSAKLYKGWVKIGEDIQR